MIIKKFFLLIICIVGFLLHCSSPGSSNNGKNVAELKGLCYGPYRDNEDPDFGIQPTKDELKDDIEFIKNVTQKIRTYGVTDNLEYIVNLCEDNELDCYPGAWISKLDCDNEKQIESLKSIAGNNFKHVKGLIVGNEVLLRQDVTEQQLIDYITDVRSVTGLKIASAETWSNWLNHPGLANAVDILFVHIYPYWDGIAVEEGTNYVLEKYNDVKQKYPDKSIFIGETGWPSQGETRDNAVPGTENQKIYLTSFMSMAEKEHIDYFYFEVFDEKWKDKLEGTAGGHWGLYYSDGQIKPNLKEILPDANNIIRPPRVVKPVDANFPLYIYKDGCDPENGFFSSGWMGELSSLSSNDSSMNQKDIIDERSTDDPYSGESCIRISYYPTPNQWAGLYWQFPVNNWGMYPGYDLSNSINDGDSIKLSFYVKGKEGGEKAEFKTGGIADEYKDSYGPVSTGIITLKNEWEKYTLDLTNENLSMVIGGFCWVTNYQQNPNGCTIYLDDIVLQTYTPGNKKSEY